MKNRRKCHFSSSGRWIHKYSMLGSAGWWWWKQTCSQSVTCMCSKAILTLQCHAAYCTQQHYAFTCTVQPEIFTRTNFSPILPPTLIGENFILFCSEDYIVKMVTFTILVKIFSYNYYGTMYMLIYYSVKLLTSLSFVHVNSLTTSLFNTPFVVLTIGVHSLK